MVLIALSGISQEVIFTVSSSSSVRVGDQFKVVYTLNTQGKDFRCPAFEGFSVLSGPNPSSSTNVSIVNGKVSRTVTTSYTLYLQAAKEGDYNFKPATVIVGDETYESKPLNIKVVKGTPSSGQQSGQQSRGGQTSITSQDVFLRTNINKQNPYLGEEVIITYKIYTRFPIPQYNIAKYPSYSGFWTHDLLEDNQQIKQYNETLNGVQYLVAELKKVATFPIKSGKLTIQPLEIDAVVQVKSNNSSRRTNDPFFDSFFNDSFFGGGYQNIEVHLNSNKLDIDVKALPLEDKPVEFGGAVGKYSLKSNIDKTNVKTNEAINLKYTVWGQGNIKLIEVLNITFPPDFEVYDPKITSNINKSTEGVSGVKTFEYLLIPRNPGNFKIKPIKFCYFDPSQGKYVTTQTAEYVINVERGEGSSDGTVYNGTTKEDIQYINQDIRYIKIPPFLLKKNNTYLFYSAKYFIILGVILLLFIISLIVWNYTKKRRSDVVMVRTRQATKVARKRLKTALNFMKSQNEKAFFNEVSHALWGYLSDKFHIPRSDLSMDSVKDALLSKEVNEDIIDEFLSVLNNCEFARFAPGDKAQNMSNIYKQALDVISKTESELK